MMKNFDSYYDPPDDDPCCEDGCGDTLEKDINGDWYCPNKFCPLKFSGVEKEMAEALVEFMDDSSYYRRRYAQVKSELESLKQQLKSNITGE